LITGKMRIKEGPISETKGKRENERRASVFIDGADSVLVDQRLMLIGVHPMATMPLKLLLSQQTGCCEQEVPPTPIMVRGEQVSPTWVLPAKPTIPRSPRRRAATGLLALSTELQHWAEPVLQELEMPEGPLLFAAATGVARRAGGFGGRPRARRSPLVSEGLASTEAAAATITARRVVNFIVR